MGRKQSSFCGVLVVAMVLMGPREPSPTEAFAQGPPPASNVTFDTVINVKGTLKSAQRNFIIVTREDGEDVTVMLHEDPTRLKVTAEAKPAFLRPQMMVRAAATLGPAGVPVEPVDRVEIFQPIQMTKMSAAVKEKFTPGLHPADRKVNPRQGFVPGSYTVVGTLAGLDPAGIYVFTGKTRVPIPLSQDAKIYLVFNNLSLAQPGDPVTVSGFHQPPDETKVIANDVTIRPERVYGDVDESAAPRGTRTRGRSRGRPAEETLPAADALAAPDGQAP